MVLIRISLTISETEPFFHVFVGLFQLGCDKYWINDEFDNYWITMSNGFLNGTDLQALLDWQLNFDYLP